MNQSWMIATAIIALGVTAASGLLLVPWLRRLKYGQTILDIGPKWHEKKQGTPTMGGIMFILGVSAALLCGYFLMAGQTGLDAAPDRDVMRARLFYGLVMALCYGLVGFLDDYIKVVKKQNEGLTARQKMLMQLAVAVVYIVALELHGGLSTIVDIPFVGQLDMGLWFYPFAVVIIIAGTVNAVNLTDGIDGLAGSVTFVAALSFMIIAAMLQIWAMSMMATALAAACVGFLIWNFYPAKVFMGDTGSLFLGGMLVALAFGVGLPIFLIPIGIIYIIETASVIIQVTYFKRTHGKRLFKMTPIHHHFEMSGWSEVKIVAVFSLVGALGGGAAIWAATLI